MLENHDIIFVSVTKVFFSIAARLRQLRNNRDEGVTEKNLSHGSQITDTPVQCHLYLHHTRSIEDAVRQMTERYDVDTTRLSSVPFA